MITSAMELRLFAALDVASGVTISNCYRRHRHQEFLRFLNDIDANLPSRFEVHLVMDLRYAQGKQGPSMVSAPPSLSCPFHADEWKLAEPGGTVCLRKSPNDESGAEATRQCEHWKKRYSNYLDRRNRDPKPFVWTADADLILGKVARLSKRISNSGHSSVDSRIP